MSAEEKAILEEFKGQFDELDKKKSAEFKSIFVQTDKITTNGLFAM